MVDDRDETLGTLTSPAIIPPSRVEMQLANYILMSFSKASKRRIWAHNSSKSNTRWLTVHDTPLHAARININKVGKR